MSQVMGMFERAEQEYAELMRKRDIIEKDKLKIEQVIEVSHILRHIAHLPQ